MNRKLIKKQARQILNNNEIGFIGLYSLKLLAVPIIFFILYGISIAVGLSGNFSMMDKLLMFYPILFFLIALFSVGFDLSADFICLLVSKNIISGSSVGIGSNIDIFAKRRCFWGAFGTRFFSGIFLALWQVPFNLALSLVSAVAFAIPDGIIILFMVNGMISICEMFFILYKTYGYSQAEYVYWDYILDGKYITGLEAIRLSKRLMKGHEVDYFLFQWSFFWWYLLSTITLGLGSFYVYPYYCLSTANYYIKLAEYTGNTPDATMIGGYAPTNQFSKHDNKHNPLAQERKYLHDTPNASNNYMHD